MATATPTKKVMSDELVEFQFSQEWESYPTIKRVVNWDDLMTLANKAEELDLLHGCKRAFSLFSHPLVFPYEVSEQEFSSKEEVIELMKKYKNQII